jgi:hypothetical protein
MGPGAVRGLSFLFVSFSSSPAGFKAPPNTSREPYTLADLLIILSMFVSVEVFPGFDISEFFGVWTPGA